MRTLLLLANLVLSGLAAAAPLCEKSQIRLVNSMREIAQPYHANLDKGGHARRERGIPRRGRGDGLSQAFGLPALPVHGDDSQAR